jgi:hypothetical protein
MAALDPARALYVQQAYRYAEVSNVALKSIASDIVAYKIDTQLSEADAAALAADIFAVTGKATRSYDIEIEGLVKPADLDGYVPTFLLYSDRLGLDGVLTRAETIKPQLLTGTTKLTVRG